MAHNGAARSPGDPKLTSQQRKWLGVEDEESVRVLNTGTRTILLERSGLGGSAVPWDRDLVMSMDVRAFSIADVLHMLHSSSKSGFVFFESARSGCIDLRSPSSTPAARRRLEPDRGSAGGVPAAQRRDHARAAP